MAVVRLGLDQTLFSENPITAKDVGAYAQGLSEEKGPWLGCCFCIPHSVPEVPRALFGPEESAS